MIGDDDAHPNRKFPTVVQKLPPSDTKVSRRKKSSSKHIDIGSSFEELVTKNLAVKTDHNFDASFKSYDFFKKIGHIK